MTARGRGRAGRQERRGTSLLLRWGSTLGIRALGSVNIRLHGSILHIGLERALSAVHQQRTGPLQQCRKRRASDESEERVEDLQQRDHLKQA